MKKINPSDIKMNFSNSLTLLETFYTTTIGALPLDSQKTFLTENSLMAMAVLWEGFISDLVVAYINRDSTRFAVHLKDSLEAGLSDKQKVILKKFALLNVPTHLSKAVILELIDNNGNNITFSHFGELVSQTKSWLITADADRFKNRTKKEQAIVNAIISLRNHIAHRSDRSHAAMNVNLAVGALHPAGLKRGTKKVNHIGAYLKAIVPKAGKTRLEVFISELKALVPSL